VRRFVVRSPSPSVRKSVRFSFYCSWGQNARTIFGRAAENNFLLPYFLPHGNPETDFSQVLSFRYVFGELTLARPPFSAEFPSFPFKPTSSSPVFFSLGEFFFFEKFLLSSFLYWSASAIMDSPSVRRCNFPFLAAGCGGVLSTQRVFFFSLLPEVFSACDYSPPRRL